MRWYGALAVLMIALLGATVPAAAQRVRPLDQILPQIRSTHPGTFYDAEGPFRGPDGRMHYRLKWMTPSGRIIWLDTDAHTGRVLGQEGGPRRPAWERGGRSERRYAPRRNERNNWRDERRDDRRQQWRRNSRPDRRDRGDDSDWRRPRPDRREEPRRQWRERGNRDRDDGSYRRRRDRDRNGGPHRRGGGRRNHW